MSNPWNDRYRRPDYYYGIEPNTFLAEHSQLFIKKGKILCLAEGEGRNAVHLAKMGFEVTAVDFSEVGLEKLKDLAKQNSVEIETICADLENYDIGHNKWDGIVSIWCHLPKNIRSTLHEKVKQGLKENGIFLLEAYTPNQLKFKTGGPQDPNLMPTLIELEEELKTLKIELGREVERDIQEGIGHRGLSAVVQFMARK
ncbi:MAG: hypothetical protein RJB66_206 [Pseudomonadota bacterium]|jgi:SAM-dependent methyltransferase